MEELNSELIQLLKPLGLPLQYIRYTGNAPTWLTFQIIDNRDEDYSDDEGDTEVTSVQLNLFIREDYTKLRSKIKKLLQEKYWDINITELYESQDKIFHVVFRFKKYVTK